MKTNMRLVLAGFAPLLAGCFFYALLLLFPGFSPSFAVLLLSSLVFLLLWGWLCASLVDPGRPLAGQLVRLLVPALVTLLLLLWQELLLGEYWPSIFGKATQLFFLPLFPLFGQLFPSLAAVGLWPLCIAVLLLLLLAAWLGCVIRNKRSRPAPENT